jgi:predicted DNA-binding ribbon-helix-helix protein
MQCWINSSTIGGTPAMRSSVIKRSVAIAGRLTSVSLEDPFWKALKDIADRRKLTLSELATLIDADRKNANLSSAIRLFVLGFYCDQIYEYEKRDRTREMLTRANRPTAS